MTGRLIRITTALAVLMVASVAAVISYQHACELVSSHGGTGATARLLPFTVDGLIWAASMVRFFGTASRPVSVPQVAAGSAVPLTWIWNGAKQGPRFAPECGLRLGGRIQPLEQRVAWRDGFTTRYPPFGAALGIIAACQ